MRKILSEANFDDLKETSFELLTVKEMLCEVCKKPLGVREKFFKRIYFSGLEDYQNLLNRASVHDRVEVDIENICEAPKLNQNQDKKFIDMLLVESSAKKLVSKSNEEIKDYSIQLMKSYHDDSNYNTSIDLDMVVEQSKVLAIESKKDEKKLIKSY